MKRLYSMAVPVVFCAFSVTATAQTEYKILEDLTSKIANADFSAGDPVNATIYTYTYNMTDAGLGAGGQDMYGQQDVTGWTNVYPSANIYFTQAEFDADNSISPNNARAAGIYAYRADESEDGPGLGGAYYAPYPEMCTTMTGGKALGIVAVWGASVQYTQEITLPAGSYMLVIPVANTFGTGTITKSLNGFFVEGGAQYFDSKNTYALDEQVNDTIVFKLDAETKGMVSVGYQGSGIGSGSAPHLFVDCVKLYKIDDDAIIAKEIAAAKEELLALIEEGEELGADTSAGKAVYNNPNATLEEVRAAIEAQKAANEAGVTDLSDFFINNAHFSTDPVIEDGICTYDYDMEKNGVTHYGMQPLSGWTATNPSDNTLVKDRNDGLNARACGVFAIGSQAFLGGAGYLPPTTMSDGTTEGKVLGFISVWGATTQYKQVTSIPAGKYTLLISYYNAGGTGTIAKNLMGFVADNGEEYLAETKTFKEGSWEEMKITFELDEPTSGYFTLGFQAANAGSGSMPHFFIDGIKLNYVGDLTIDPSLLALQAVISSQSPLLEEAMNADLHDKLADAISEGSALVSSQSTDADANKAALDAISAIIDEVHASIAAYNKLHDFITKLEGESNDEELQSIGNLGTIISDMLDEAYEAYENGTLTNEEIDELIARHDPMIVEEVQRALNSENGPGTNITALLTNPTFDNGSTGWSGTAPTVRAGVAEFYNKTFDMYQTLEGLPNGKYEIKVSGFFRFDNTDNTLAAHQGGYEDDYITAYIYGNEEQTKFKSIFAGATFEGIKTATKDDGTEVSYVYDQSDVETELGYVPNTMEGFAAAEAMTKAYETTAVALVTDGTLRIGVRCNEKPSNTAWAIFDSFRVKYVGNSASDYAESILNAAQELQAACDAYLNDDVKLPEDTQKNVADLAVEADNVAANPTSVDECVAMLEKLTAAKKHLSEVAAQIGEFTELVEYYEEALQEFEDITSAYELDLDGYYAKIDNGWETEAELAADITGMQTEWGKYVQDGNAGASAAKPFEVTAMLRNPKFTWQSADTNKYWSFVNQYGDAAEGIIEFYGKTTWEVSQKVAGLVPGYYRLSVQACYRPHQQLTDVVKDRMEGNDYHDVFVFANNGRNEYTAEIMNILDSEQDLSEVVVDGANRNATLEADLVTKHHTYPAGTTLISPTGHAYTAAYFHYDPEYTGEENQGYWKNNTVDFKVEADDIVTLGAKKTEENTDGGNWTPLDNFQLFYLGTTAPDAVKGIQDGTAASMKYYTVGGMQLSRPQKGINIVVTTLSDGSKTSSKVIVK